VREYVMSDANVFKEQGVAGSFYAIGTAGLLALPIFMQVKVILLLNGVKTVQRAMDGLIITRADKIFLVIRLPVK